MAHRPKIDNAAVPARSKQNLSCNWTGTADFGRLVPFHWEELLQGDHVIKCSPRIEMQMLPLASPTFGKIDLYAHYFVVPLRQLDKNFYEKWSQTGLYRTDYFSHLCPKTFNTIYNDEKTASIVGARAFYKHWTSLGLPPFFARERNAVTDDSTPISLYPFFAYNKIWWDFYRDPEVLRDESKLYYLTDETIVNSMGYRDAEKYLSPHVRSIKNNWISDLFAQGGIISNEWSDPYLAFSKFPFNNSFDNQANFGSDADYIGIASQYIDDSTEPQPVPTSHTVQMNRLIEALTRLSERLSLSGKREIEALFARYGVKPKWSEMNLCRYVGGAKSTVMVDDIIATSDTEIGEPTSEYPRNGLPLGAKAGAGYCALNSLDIEVSVDEPSILMGILSVMPHIHYVQGLSKKWQRKELTDFFQSSLQYVGEVAVAKREVGVSVPDMAYTDAEDGNTFAFCDPYYEYKMGLDVLAGDFMLYHNETGSTGQGEPSYDLQYMQSMEQYINFPVDREFDLNNMLVDGDQFNKIFKYLGGSIFEDVDDHFHICVDKEVIIDRPMEGFAVPTLETTQDPHSKTAPLGKDTIL